MRPSLNNVWPETGLYTIILSTFKSTEKKGYASCQRTTTCFNVKEITIYKCVDEDKFQGNTKLCDMLVLDVAK